MKVITRSGVTEEVKFDLITEKIKILSSNNKIWGKKLEIDPIFIAQNICSLIYDGISTTELDEFSANFAATLFKNNPDYLILSGRISINNHHKNTSDSFLNSTKELYDLKLVTQEFYNIVIENSVELEKIVDSNRDYNLNFFGFKTLQASYLLKSNGKIIERPQYLFMRVAIQIHKDNMALVKKVYDSISNKYYTHATPTLFNSCTNFQQLSSCFLMGTEDSVKGIYKSASDMAEISKHAGGIGGHFSNVRSKDSHISKTNGKSNGLMPLLRVFNNISRHINQGGKRNGSFAIYIEPWHPDIFDFLDAKKNNGAEEMRARDLFYGLWIPDLFMKRVENDDMWSLMCPNECKGLCDTYGEEFENLYLEYEVTGNFRKQIKATVLWERIINCQIETGSPYMLYKDSINRKSNQKHYGIIKSSNLCTEIVQYSDSKETAVCNLASLCLPSYLENGIFNFELLGEKTKELVVNLNNIIDCNAYPTPESKLSNMKHRPMGIGVQGLADVFMILKMPYDSEEARKLNRDIFECMYYNALVMSCELAKNEGPYETFPGSPTSNGLLQFDLWNVKPQKYSEEIWNKLKIEIKEHGLRNSLLIAPMPTASTAQIMGNNESFEPYTSNIYTRAVLSGNYIVMNNHLVDELRRRNLYNKDIIERIMLEKGSVQNIDIPQDIKDIYKTAWELPQKCLLNMAIDRGPFIDQSQSLNLFVNPPQQKVVHSIHMYGWKNGLKTGSYYIRTKSVLENQNFTTEVSKEKSKYKSKSKSESESKEECLACSA
jgi:ribonucleoside-diphosphate reductase alpha chain